MEKSVPDFIKNRIDVKRETLVMFANALDALKDGKFEGVSLPQNTQLIIFTNFGLVEGKLETYVKEPDTASQIILDSIFKARNSALAERESQCNTLATVNNSAVLIVKDATITPFANPEFKNNVSELYLFCDQITGFTCGEKNSD